MVVSVENATKSSCWKVEVGRPLESPYGAGVTFQITCCSNS